MMEALRDPESVVRCEAAHALGSIGPGAVEAIPLLIDALRDSEKEVRISTAKALEQIRPGIDEAKPALLEAKEDEYEYERRRNIWERM